MAVPAEERPDGGDVPGAGRTIASRTGGRVRT